MRNKRAWPQQCWKSCANESNIVALRFGDHGTKEMLGVVGWKVWPDSNFAQQHATTCNSVCKRTQHVTSNNVGSCWPTMLRPFARGLRLLSCILSKDDNLILGYPFWSQPLWYVVNFMKKVLSCKSRHITILIQRLYMRSIIKLELGIISELSGVRFLLLLNDIYPLYQCLLFLLSAGRRLIQCLYSRPKHPWEVVHCARPHF